MPHPRWTRVAPVAAQVLILLLGISHPMLAEDRTDALDDIAEDGLEGGEAFVPKASGFAGIPLIITNPSIGNGLGAAALYIHAQSEEDVGTTQRNMSGVFGFYTDEDSWMLGGMHSGSYKHDRMRLKAFGGYAQLRMKFYGTGSDPNLGDNPIGYGLDSIVGVVVPSWRVGESDWFLGPNYLGMFSTFETGGDLGLPKLSHEFSNAAWGATATHDTTNSNIAPTRGGSGTFIGYWFGEWAFGDFNYGSIETRYRHYFPMGEKTVIAARTMLKYTGDNAPFFARSTLNLRGFDKNRYGDNIAVDAESEYRRKLGEAFGVVGFGGLGTVAGTLGEFGDARLIWSLGTGLRYTGKRSQGMAIGLEAAVSNDEWAWYFTMGEAFR